MNSITHYLPSASLIVSLATKVLAEAAAYLPDSSCPKQLSELAIGACAASVCVKTLEMLSSPSHFQSMNCLFKYHGKIAFLVCGTAIIGFGLYEGLYGTALTCHQIYELTNFTHGSSHAAFHFSSTVLNSVSLSFAGLAKILAGKAVITNGLAIKV